MKNFITLLCFLLLFLTACGRDDHSTQDMVEEQDYSDIDIEEAIGPSASLDLLQIVAKDPKDFRKEFNKLDNAQQYYFCAAFAMGAMSVSKPATASAMVNYFIGLGVAEYNRGIDSDTYKAFDFGKNIFHFEPVVNTILHKKICENIIGRASEDVKHKKLTTKKINELGKVEVKKIVDFIRNTH